MALKEDHDLILMDIQMPVLGGIEAAKILLSQGYTRPITAMTTNVMISDVKHDLKSGFSGYIPKPFKPHELVDALDKHLKYTLKT